jgi:subtilisin family serine protease
MNEYVVLRMNGFTGGMFNGAEPDAGALAADTDRSVTIETARLTEKQADQESRDARNVVAPNMPVSLIAPLAAADFGAAELDAVGIAKAAGMAWGVAEVRAPGSHLTGKGVKVAVLDTGIDIDYDKHPAFAGVNVVGRNFTSEVTNDFADRTGHGTHCAGTIFGRDVGGVRIGVAPGVTDVLIGKVLDDRGNGTSAMVIDALYWAHGKGANVVSMSLGFDFPEMQRRLEEDDKHPKQLATSMALRAYRENLRLFDSLLQLLMLESSQNKGMVVVAATGNASKRHEEQPFAIDVSLPAAATPVISVAAYGRSGDTVNVAPFSNINPTVCAPGVEIVSARLGGGLTAMNGTSMACPHVAGLAALWWEDSVEQGYVNGGVVRAKLVASAATARPRLPITPVDGGAGRPIAPAP